MLRRSYKRGKIVTLLEVNYPNCTNFEGNKILVFVGSIRTGITYLDPHFTKDNELIARFRPNNIEVAHAFCRMISEEEN